jgi:hypothetical protein
MSLEHLAEVSSTQLRWRKQLAALPRALRFALARLTRRESRNYLTVDGQVVARFVSAEDHLAFMLWLHQTHTSTFDYGFEVGKEVIIAQHLAAEADAGQPGTP